MFLLTIFLCYVLTIVNSYNLLNSAQRSSISRLIRNPNLQTQQHISIQKILFNYYSAWAKNKAYVFKREHRYICKNCRIDDLTTAALTGLYKGTQKYNGNSSFTHYVNYYIQGELYKATRRAKIVTMPNTSPEYVPITNTEYIDFWTTILSRTDITPFQKKIIEYKFSQSVNKINSNKQIAKLMACSEETVRQSLKKIIPLLQNQSS